MNEQSIFTGHQLKADSLRDKIHLQNREYWIPSVILFSILILVWARNSHNKRFSRISKAFFNIREFYQVVREEYAMTNSLSIGMMLLFVLIISVFFFQLNSYYGLYALSPSAFFFYLKIVASVLSFFIIKMLIVSLLGALFYDKSDQVTDFLYNIFLTNNVSGILLIPIVVFMAYFRAVSMPLLIFTSGILLISIYLYRVWRSFNISAGEGRVSKLYFFAYLCSLELLPFVVIFKVIIRK